ncbi:hypothetical protein BGX28_005476, partial [Mortierella sp. GBA30]
EALTPAMLQPWYLTHTWDSPQVVNMYGPTETTVYATYRLISPDDCVQHTSPIGVRLPDVRTYVLDDYGQPVPLGAVGELYVGGAGVARGYLNQSELTAERFLPDPFSVQLEARMYRTGDLVKYLEDGKLIYLGRNDQQVKIRGYRIELGEIEARLVEHPLVSETVVVALDDQVDKRLVAYVVIRDEDQPKTSLEEYQLSSAGQLGLKLRSHLMKRLPEYMVPVLFVRIDTLPLNPNGKLDRNALLVSRDDHYARQTYEMPRGHTERTIAALWSDLLSVERVSRHDNFFALGGHSLLATKVLENLRRIGLTVSVRALFECPTLCALARVIEDYGCVAIPSNLIVSNSETLTPEMLPLIDLNQNDIDNIVDKISGGLPNIQDIYSLSPLQEGILFHHLLATEGDPYLLTSAIAFENRTLLDHYLAAFQTVVDRHDILRTAFFWEEMSTSAQVVCRSAPLPIEELILDPADGIILEQLDRRFNPKHYRITLCRAPLLRFIVAKDTDNRWVLIQLMHHLIGDHDAVDDMYVEVKALLEGKGNSLPEPRPFRDHLAQIRLRSSPEADEKFFKGMLADVEEPTLPFGLTKIDDGGAEVKESHQVLSQDLNNRLRLQAKKLCVSLATLCHVAWAQVLAQSSGQRVVVFGTLLFGRLQFGDSSGRALGLFMNTLPFRCEIAKGNVQDCVRDTHSRLTALLEHEHASLAMAQSCSGIPAGTPLFSGLMNYRHTSPPSASIPGASDDELVSQEGWFKYPGLQFLSSQERTNYPFALFVDDFGKGLGLTAQVMQPIDPARICAYMRKALESLADALEIKNDMPIQELEILPDKERELQLRIWNETPAGNLHQLCLQHLFEQQVKNTPEAIAVEHEDLSLTYSELNTRANSLAHRLIALEVRPDTCIAICVSRSIAMVIGILAVLKAGGAYVPLDPAHASERLLDILVDVSPSILLADSIGRRVLQEADLSSLKVIDPSAPHKGSTANPCVPGLSTRHLAYVIYTSGSTGKPKGVMVEHRHITRLFSATDTWFDFKKSDVWCLFHSFAFDVSVWEIWGALRNGGKLVIISQDIARSPQDLYRLVCELGITVLNMTPSAFKPIIECHTRHGTRDSMRYVILAGEALTPAMMQPWYLTHTWDSPQVVNMYGPTETTVYATYRLISPDDCVQHTSPIGVRLPDVRTYVLDDYGQPVPLGAVGELYVGGAGVARGYLNQSELTAERFLPDPFSVQLEARMYRTGDLVKYLEDGKLIYLGRNDQQVKIRGYRIELGEIEARLIEHQLVSEAVVIALGEGSEKRLIAYVAIKTMDQYSQSMAEWITTLRSHLAFRLPNFMIPAAFVRMDSLPLTTNGKLDRRGLVAPGRDDFACQTYDEPKGEVENALARIWMELLHVEQVSRHDSFFELGGHSLLAVQMISRLHHLGYAVSVRTIFESPALSLLAQSIGKHCDVAIPANLITPDTSRITPEMLPLIDLVQSDINRIVERVPGGISNVQDIYALSPLQECILIQHMMAKSGDPYAFYTSMSFDTRASLDGYLAAVQHIINRHDVLRTSFMWQTLSTPAQIVWRNVPLSIRELELDPAAGPASQQLKRMFDLQNRRIDLTQAPLLRFVVAQDSDGSWILVELLHHLIIDHSTLDNIQIEIKAFQEGQEATLPSSQPYRNLIAQARLGLSQEAHEKFFKEMLAEIDTPSLPFGIATVDGDGTLLRESQQMLSQGLNNHLRSQAKRLGVSVASLCHVAWAQVIARTSGQQNVVFGTVLFGRMHVATSSDGAMGLFINVLPIRVDIGKDSVERCVRATHARLAALIEHEHASLAQAQHCSNVATGMPLISTLLNYRHNVSPPVDYAAYGMRVLESEERTNYPFCLSVEEYGTSLGLTAHIILPLDPVRICSYMEEALDNLAAALELNPNMPAEKLEVLSMDERQMLLRNWNATQEEYPDHLCLHHLFEQQVERTPDSVAVVHEDQFLTYAEMNTRANCLAHQLIQFGVCPDNLVAICVQRSPALVIGILAIMKAGGAYVPLDPSHASDRLRDILRDTAPVCVMADSTGRHAIGESSLSCLTVMDPSIVSAHSMSNPLVPALTSCHLAYVIFTSGTTGKPKGVMVEHRGVVNLIMSRQEYLHVETSSRATQFFSVAFDGSVCEIFGTLCFGGSLHLLRNDTRLDRHQLWNYLDQHLITHSILPPVVLQDCEDLSPLSAMSRLIFAGESLSMKLARKVLELALNGKVVNEYGPTETTVAATSWMYSGDSQHDIAPIGRPLTNRTIYLLDMYGNPTPLGAVGELYIGGVGVARGYLNRPDLTAERFLPDPFCGKTGNQMYRTGDLAKYLPDGNLVYLGRLDHQVKIRGFRIELGEIEARLMEHTLVSESVVIALGAKSNKRLIAYVVIRYGPRIESGVHEAQLFSAGQLATILRSHLSTRLPEYMIPVAFVRMDAFPLTPNGKLDRNALPAPENHAFAVQSYEEPRGEIESILSNIWIELLKIGRVGRNDSFFAVGGHSLMAVTMIGRIRAMLGFDISLRTLMEAPTIAELALRLVATGIRHEESYDVLLPIKPKGSRSPLFCIHPGLGLSWCYTGLSTHLDPDQPLYGLQAHGFIGDGNMASTLDEMVRDYIGQICRIQPHGPYYLLGYSFGGLVAHTMASYLEKLGEHVALVALMDTHVDCYSREGRESFQDDSEEFDVVARLLGKREHFFAPELINPFLDRMNLVMENNRRLFRLGVPCVISADLVVFRATVLQKGYEKLMSPDDWKPYVLGDIEVHDIESEHGYMDLPKPMAIIGRALNQKLNELHNRV